MKHTIRNTLLAALLLGAMPATANAAQEAGTNGQELLIVNQGTNVFVHNGWKSWAAQPSVVKKGVTFVAAKTIMKEFYGTVVFDSKTKQYALQSGNVTLRFTANAVQYRANGNAKTAPGAPYVQGGTLMVPLKTLATHFGATMSSVGTNRVELRWSMKPVAKFSVSDLAPYAKETEVSYKDEAYSPRGNRIVDERWENRTATFDEPGAFTVTRWVQDDKGVWSDPYSVVVYVKPENKPPVASFVTDRDTYKMGEYIRYFDRSTDDESKIAKREWTNGKQAFFEPGEQTITLRVTDSHGLTGEYAKTIRILDETLYSEDQFNLRYTPIGDKFAIKGADVLQYRTVGFSAAPSGQMTLIRENSPETIVDEGIYYAASNVSGNVRLMLHNHNKRSTAVQAYVVATNTGAAAANATLGPIGIGGPNLYVSLAGKAAAGKYLDARLKGVAPQRVTIPPGESRVLFPAISANVVDPGDVYSLYADASFDRDVQLRIAYVDAGKDIFAILPGLPVLEMNGHSRGTFPNADRLMTIDETLGDVKGRLILGDGVFDPRLPGVDETNGAVAANSGNYGVMYTIKLNDVKPHTAIAVNPRGGFYAGAFNVNGRVVYTTSNTIISNSSEACMLYRTGDETESVTIAFTPASGSNLPINLLFMPIAQ
ncbi:stalk domain-containing protein [Cohnella sp. GCM10027633]|uniref:stalk domain-containing protein n=1 Tax=unclassified Cohnella TaxID=2636738 RepID=UPI003643C982